MLLSAYRVVAVVICAPTFEHETIVRTALQNGAFIYFIMACLFLPATNVISILYSVLHYLGLLGTVLDQELIPCRYSSCCC